MFGSDSGTKDKTKFQGKGPTTLIAKGTEIIGEIHFSGCLEIEGVVKGNLVAAEDADGAIIRLQPSGKILGDIVAPTVVVNSRVEGNIYSSRRIELAAQAEVVGDVHYQIIEMVKGSQVNGSLLYSPQSQPTQSSTNAVQKTDSGGPDQTVKAGAS